MSNTRAPLNDTIALALAQLVDDAQSGRREPSHDDLKFQINRVNLADGDPVQSGQPIGKAKRIRAVLSWALENDVQNGSLFVQNFLSLLKSQGSFREGSPNYAGAEAIKNAVDAFAGEGYFLDLDGSLRPRMLEGLSGVALTDALKAQVRRAIRNADDSSLVVGTGKDFLEAIAAHILQQKYGTYPSTANFPTLLGQAFVALEFATTQDTKVPNELPTKRVERAMFELACALNQLRNREGTGHGRPWLPYVGDSEAKLAIESMGIIGARMLAAHMGED